MTPQIKRRIQIFLVVLLVVAGIRILVIFQRRHEGTQPQQTAAAPPLNADYYVNPRRLHSYDAASLRKDLVNRPVWVKEGYRFAYFPLDARGRADLKNDAGTLGPLEKLDITAITSQQTASTGQQVLAAFRKDGKDFALPVGVIQGEQQKIYADEIFFYDDPRQLYKHWPPEVWESVERHEVKPGMNELQASFAVGMGVPDPSGAEGEKTVRYPNGGRPLTVVYRNGRATQVTPG